MSMMMDEETGDEVGVVVVTVLEGEGMGTVLDDTVAELVGNRVGVRGICVGHLRAAAC